MASLDPLHPVQSSVIETLSQSPGRTTAELHADVKDLGNKISLQNLYRTLGQMLEAQILVREKRKFSLNLVWVSRLKDLTENATRLYIEGREMLDLPKNDGEKREFFAESLAALDPIWNHILLTISENQKGISWYEYNSHPYHFLTQTDTEQRLYTSLGKRGLKIYGNDTFLDRYGVALNPDGNKVIINAKTPFPKEGYSLWLCGDFIVDCVFPEALAQIFAAFFRSVQSVEEFKPQLFLDIFKMKARCRLLVWKSKKEADHLKEKFLPFFGRAKRNA